LRNPLAPIRSAVDVLKRRTSSDDLTRVADVIDRQASLMARLLDDLLDVARIAHDKLELRCQRVELNALIRDVADAHRFLIETYHHSITLALTPAPVYLDADRSRLAQILGNLFNNACRYTPPGGTIVVTSTCRGPLAEVTVRDSGIGIPADKLSTIFDLFSQIEPTLDQSRSGLGIGLRLVKVLTERHGGTVEATSDGPGRGSEFIVRLPVVAPPALDMISTAEPPRRAAEGRRILIVDDNIDAAESLSLLLSVAGHETEVCHDGESALHAAERLRPDMILLDIGLPGLSGLDVCRQVRTKSWGQETMVIALTGWGQELNRRQSEEAGFDHHLVKPVDYDVLDALLTSMDSSRVKTEI
jgi:CheY-like chemotaxis protein/two-component sensor histidine kinase